MSIAPIFPLGILAGGTLALVLTISFAARKVIATAIALTTLTLAYVFVLLPRAGGTVGSLFLVDSYSRYFAGLILVCSITVLILEHLYLAEDPKEHGEACALILTSTLGACVIVWSTHLVSFFLGLETLTVPLYVLIAFSRRRASLEASFKYLVLASVSTAFLLFGMAFIYAAFGTLDLTSLLKARQVSPNLVVFVWVGIALLWVAIGFKLALVPFHLWAPDIYQGATAPIAGFVATVSKGAIFAFVLRHLAVATGHSDYSTLAPIITAVAIASMLAGNWLALLQTNLKRLLGYSSIAHAGYALIAFQASGPLALEAAAYYLLVYFISILVAFGAIAVLATEHGEYEAIADYDGLAWHHPGVCIALTLSLLSLAGIPLTAGFIGKFFLFAAAAKSQLWILIGALVVGSAIGIYYYLRVIVAFYQRAEGPVIMPGATPSTIPPSQRVGLAGYLALIVLSVAVLALGMFPAPFIKIISSAVGLSP